MKEYDSAFIETVLVMASETRKQNKRLFIAVVTLASIVVAMVVCFFIWLTRVEFTSSVMTTETTTITQDTGEGSGNNIYQSGEHATYNDGR